MKKLAKWIMIFAAALALTGAFVACGNNSIGDGGNGGGGNSGGDEEPGSGSGSSVPPSVDTNTFTVVTEVENGYTSAKDGEETVYTFTKGGEYTVSGELNGRLVFDSDIDSKATLRLAGCTITSHQTAVYWAKDGNKIELKADEGTTNTIEVLPTFEGATVHNAIESENNVELGGKGALTIIAGQNHAVKGSNIDIKGSVQLTITAVHDGLHAKQIAISGGTTTISGCNDAIDAEKNSKNEKGTFTMTDGALTVKSCAVVFDLEASATVEAGTIAIIDCVDVFDTQAAMPTVNFAQGAVTVNGAAYVPPAAGEQDPDAQTE